MNSDKYRYVTNEIPLDFQFESDGPKGKIKKLVSYTLQNAGGFSYFNLAFGDIDETTGELNDLARSDNEDRNKILATIAATVIEVTENFPDIMVYAEGSTPAGTRLYRIGIAANWEEIESILTVYGLINGKWQPFTKNVNYEAFMGLRKKRNFAE